MSAHRRRSVAVMAVAAWIAAGATALACPICFQMDQGPVTKGAIAAVIVLMSVTVGVLVCFGRFAVRLARRDGNGAA